MKSAIKNIAATIFLVASIWFISTGVKRHLGHQKSKQVAAQQAEASKAEDEAINKERDRLNKIAAQGNAMHTADRQKRELQDFQQKWGNSDPKSKENEAIRDSYKQQQKKPVSEKVTRFGLCMIL